MLSSTYSPAPVLFYYLSLVLTYACVVVGSAQSIVGKRCEIWDEATGKFRQAQIEDVKVEWINDGTQLKVQHSLRFIEEHHVKTDQPKKKCVACR